MNDRIRIYEAIKNAGGWIDLDRLSADLRICRKDLSNSVRSMVNTCAHKYPGLEIVSKRKKAKGKFGSQKAAYDIKYRWVQNGK